MLGANALGWSYLGEAYGGTTTTVAATDFAPRRSAVRRA